ncbi:MAG: hydroxymethylglutaryl-CoA reductase, degradative [Candidatus Aenigmarchaeota archaeon]|nr:hydroxymethylglutaryl-CoA reductase, degradative [Candidatus Aenigmarchaeota archaeon]
MKSSIRGFYELPHGKRLQFLKKFAKLSNEEVRLLGHNSALGIRTAEMISENVVGTTQLPIGIATNFLVNGKDYLVPMAIEEPSVVAAASHAAKLARHAGGFTASSDEPVMIGQVQLVRVPDAQAAAKLVAEKRGEIMDIANRQDSVMVRLGGGIRDIGARVLKTKRGDMMVVQLLVDVRDAMGANAVNTMCEAVSPYLEELTGGTVRLRIISNLATRRLARARAVWSKDILGADVIDGILDAYAFAEADQYRCTTHNKGIMNGIDAVAIATGNDFRALEAGAHSYASIGGYHSLTNYETNDKGDLIGSIELPIASGIIGGTIRTHPIAKLSLKILGVQTAQELAQVMATVGLAQNFAALRALASEGIQKGHMSLHAKNIAVLAGASGKQIEKIAKRMASEKNVSVSRAKELLGKRR